MIVCMNRRAKTTIQAPVVETPARRTAEFPVQDRPGYVPAPQLPRTRRPRTDTVVMMGA